MHGADPERDGGGAPVEESGRYSSPNGSFPKRDPQRIYVIPPPYREAMFNFRHERDILWKLLQKGPFNARIGED